MEKEQLKSDARYEKKKKKKARRIQPNCGIVLLDT